MSHEPSKHVRDGKRSAHRTEFEENSYLSERFGRSRNAIQEPYSSDQPVASMQMKVNYQIRRYVKAQQYVQDSTSWKDLPEFPESAEVFDPERRTEPLELESNTIVGPYPSKEKYLLQHYTLLREDAIGPLRDVIFEVQNKPHLLERDATKGSQIYDKVYITGLCFANSGIAARIKFSLGRIQRGIKWEQSKRLRTGTIVALTPANAIFKWVAHIAIVAARPLAGLKKDPPSIDIFFVHPEEIQFDPQQEWILVESQNGFYEGHRHVMRGLQMLGEEPFPLMEQIVELNRDIEAPNYIRNSPYLDCSDIFPANVDSTKSVNITKPLPQVPSYLDDTQMKALQRILGKRLSLVQGPPGTGKTHVSVVGLRLLLRNRPAGDPPIIVTSHTNHALDQLLRHIAKFEPDFIRLGAMSRDRETIMPRTLFELRLARTFRDPQGCLRTPAMKEMRLLTKQMIRLLESFTLGNTMVKPETLEKHGILSVEQVESLVKGAKSWFNADTAEHGEFDCWLGDEKMEARLRMEADGFGFSCDDQNIDYEELQEVEAEGRTLEDDDKEALRGERIDFSERWTGRKLFGVSEAIVKDQLKKQDMYEIPEEDRGPVYRYMQARLKAAIATELRQLAKSYTDHARDANIGRWEVDYNFLKDARIIGVTTSGLAKYRGLLQSLNPKIVMVEEAAETLESYTAVAAFSTLEHLILVGDHQQLRGRCHLHELETDPFWLGISMFERLVRNEMEYTQLQRQRRMTPEIRRILAPVYPGLVDDESVLNRSPILSMDVNTFFFSHSATEIVDENMSRCNEIEADLIVGFFSYLNANGLAPEKITVLTFYNGQRKLIGKKLRLLDSCRGRQLLVVTVDSYQGDENDVILLSLVRSNVGLNIGFLDVENRIVVALSRAQRGFYIFGNAPIMCKASTLWWEVTQIMAKKPCRVGFHLPLKCSKHGNFTFVKEAEDMKNLNGGCSIPCSEMLPCFHSCPLRCHPNARHESVQCERPCDRLLACGHGCARLCYQNCSGDCDCKGAENAEENAQPPRGYAQVALKSQQNVDNAQRQLLDDENAASLFGSGDDKLTPGMDKMTLVGVKDDGARGQRQVWTGTYLPLTPLDPSKPEPKQKRETSLLD